VITDVAGYILKPQITRKTPKNAIKQQPTENQKDAKNEK